MTQLLYSPIFTAFNSDGNLIPGARLYAYRAGTNTPETLYLDAEGETPATHPVIADASGVFPPLWGTNGTYYKLVFKDTCGANFLPTVDNVSAGTLNVTPHQVFPILGLWSDLPDACPEDIPLINHNDLRQLPSLCDLPDGATGTLSEDLRTLTSLSALPDGATGVLTQTWADLPRLCDL